MVVCLPLQRVASAARPVFKHREYGVKERERERSFREVVSRERENNRGGGG